MFCSKCSEIIRPVVAVDIDGTLGDYHGHFIEFASQYVGDSLYLHYNGSPGFREWFKEANNIDTEEYRAIKLAYRQGGMKRSMPIFEGATALIKEIKVSGAELWVTTTRPYLSLDNIVPDTVEWLRRHQIEYDGMLFDEDKYAQLVQRVDPERIVAVIDDLPDMCEAANEAVGREVAILMGTKYNQTHRDYRNTMVDIYHEIGPIIEEWKEKHGDSQEGGDQLRGGASESVGQMSIDL